ncbi:MAG: hypothetical protein J6M30_08350 [Bacteroidales bacterium]|nr:hypothetical protein [Bacteroidales bacterium]
MGSLTIERQRYNIIERVMNISNAALLKKFDNYIKQEEQKIARQNIEDGTCMSEQEFFAMVDGVVQDVNNGNYTLVSTREELKQHLNSL